MYDAMIIVNGEIPAPSLWQDIPYRTLICTDGAALFLKNLSITPDIIIGDMDSISNDTLFSTHEAIEKHFPQSRIISISEQISTDFEKALKFAKENHFKNIICLGTLGKSADHSVHNLSLLNRYAKSMQIMLMHSFEQSRQWVFILQEKTCITTKIGDIISFFPFGEATLTTKGLMWELQQSLLSHTGEKAVRNMTQKETIEIHCQGDCVCFLTSDEKPNFSFKA